MTLNGAIRRDSMPAALSVCSAIFWLRLACQVAGINALINGIRAVASPSTLLRLARTAFEAYPRAPSLDSLLRS